MKARDRLILVRIKIERAKKHLSDLESELLGWRDENRTIVIRGEKTTAPLDFSQGTPVGMTSVPILPANVIAAAGDVVHNLRSALDHLAYQLALVGSPNTDPGRQVGFPIAKDSKTYEIVKKKKVQKMRPEAVKAIDALQPYKGSRNGDVLWRIHELDNINKHRTHFTVDHDYLLSAAWMPGDFLVRTANTPHFAGIEGFDQGVQENVQLEMERTLTEAELVPGKALLPSLHQLVDVVEKIISDFEPLLE